jgi:hypothetical protein
LSFQLPQQDVMRGKTAFALGFFATKQVLMANLPRAISHISVVIEDIPHDKKCIIAFAASRG